MSNKEKISIIIPVFNGEAFLGKCMNSLLSQTYQNIEIIFVNDGSTDNTQLLLGEYKKSAANVIVIDKENEGPGVARNYGLDVATGDIVMFLDVDDYLSDNCCEMVCEFMSDAASDFICFGARFFSKDSQLIDEIKYNHGQLKGYEILDNFYSIGDIKSVVWNKAYRKKIIDEYNIRFSTNRINEDALFVMMVALFSKEVKFVPTVLYHHTSINPTSYSNNITLEHFSSTIEVLATQKNILCKFNIFEFFERAYKIHSAKLLTHLFYLAALNIRNYSNYVGCSSIVYGSGIWIDLCNAKILYFPLNISFRILLCRSRLLLWVVIKFFKMINIFSKSWFILIQYGNRPLESKN